jgi:hypothetical protein
MTSIKLIYSVMFYLRVRVDCGVTKQKKIELNRLLGGQKGFFLIDNSHYLDESKYLYHRSVNNFYKHDKDRSLKAHENAARWVRLSRWKIFCVSTRIHCVLALINAVGARSIFNANGVNCSWSGGGKKGALECGFRHELILSRYYWTLLKCDGRRAWTRCPFGTAWQEEAPPSVGTCEQSRISPRNGTTIDDFFLVSLLYLRRDLQE